MNEEINEYVKRFVETLKPKVVFLFGSYARGDYNKESDYDFYIVMPGKRKVSCNTVTKAYSSLQGIKTKPVDIIVKNEVTFLERKNYIGTIEQIVAREGIKMYEKE